MRRTGSQTMPSALLPAVLPAVLPALLPALLPAVLLALLLGLTAACGSGDNPDYAPKPDADLFAAIEEIPGVSTVNITSYDGATQGTGYNGQVAVDATTDPVDVMDRTLAILWQGLPGATYESVRVVQDEKATRPSDIGLDEEDDFVERYGPQPGTGAPPTDKPALELQE